MGQCLVIVTLVQYYPNFDTMLVELNRPNVDYQCVAPILVDCLGQTDIQEELSMLSASVKR